MWNLVGQMDCIDLGLDHFLVKFELAEDMDNILKGGPWFINWSALPSYHAMGARIQDFHGNFLFSCSMGETPKTTY